MSTHDWDGTPPDPEPSDRLKAMLASALEQGAPLEAPHPSQARYSLLAGQGDRRQPWRRPILAFAAGAALMSLALLLAGVPQPRTWIVQTVDSVVHDITAPAVTLSHESSTPGTQPERSEPPEATPSESETHESPPAAGESPSGEAGEAAPTPSPESSGDGDHATASPSPSPTPDSRDGGGSGGGGSDGDGASSPSPTPTPDSDGGH
ncbi:MAG TPA: hypothetical protein VN965_06390 [Candidatus Dormibacteraeota bacterium]|nr:hypothetical protein [Candidatus Dormibacteraeota bacterium]